VQSGIDTPVTPPTPLNNSNHGTTHIHHAKHLPNPLLERCLDIDNILLLAYLPRLSTVFLTVLAAESKEPFLLSISPFNNV
jgi:hypothetical protein